MIKSVEFTGRTEDDAIQAALKSLGLDRDEVSVEILDRAKSGFLGIGATPAKIRVSYEAPDEREIEKERPSKPAPTAPAVPAASPPAVSVDDLPWVPAASDSKVERIDTFLNGLLLRMGASAKVGITQAEDGSYAVQLTGEGLGMLIGRRGETLDAIQHIVNYAVNNGEEQRSRVIIDAEDYRSKREESLSKLAQKVAVKVIKYRRNFTLEPMNSYERHVIHTALQDYAGVTTYSIGTEPNRRIVVALDRKDAPAPTRKQS